MITDADIDRLGAILAREASSPAKVVLFGSRARGEAAAESDLDFLVIEDAITGRGAEMARLRAALPDVGVPIDVIVVARADADRRRHEEGSVVQVALREGRVLVER